MNYIFGPVPSRRLGISLGIDIIPYKKCPFDCIYCQLGRTTNKTLERREYVPLNAVVSELRRFAESIQPVELTAPRESACMPDYITLSGSGEPTLNSCMGELIKTIKGINVLSDTPVAVLTNSSLISDAEVRAELCNADLVIPSLDAATQEVFEKINRPYNGLAIRDIIRGLQKFRKEFDGKIWLEIMLVGGFNDNEGELMELSGAIQQIMPDRIQLNTVIRPPVEEYAKALSVERCNEIAGILNAEVIAEFDKKTAVAYTQDNECAISSLLKRRPCTLSDISGSLGMHKNEILKYIEVMKREGRIKTEVVKGKKYVRWKGNDKYK